MLDLRQYIICKIDLPKRVSAENVMKFYDLPQSFTCDHFLKTAKFINAHL